MSNSRVSSSLSGGSSVATTEAEADFSGFDCMGSEEVELRNSYKVEESVIVTMGAYKPHEGKLSFGISMLTFR